MSDVVSFKVPKELKKKVEELKDLVDWPSEFRAFLRSRVKSVERELVIRKIMNREVGKRLPAGSVARAIREDREGA